LRTNFSHRTWGLSPRLSVFRRDVEDHVAVVLDMTMPVLITAGYARESAQKKVTDNELIDFLQKPFLPKPEFPPEAVKKKAASPERLQARRFLS